MKLDITGLHMEITEAIKDFTTKKVEKLSRFFDDDVLCHITYTAKDGKININIRIQYKSRTYIADELTTDVYSDLDDVIEKIEGQIRKNKSIIDKKRREGIAEKKLDELTIEDLDNE